MTKTQTYLFPPPEPKFAEASIRWELPDLSPTNTISFDTETTGLKIWKGDRPVGLSVSVPTGESWYIPWGHEEGFNFDIEKVIQWIKDNFRDKEVLTMNGKFDYNMMYMLGVDLEDLNVRLRDVMHCPALLYSNRMDYSVDALSKEFLNKNKVNIGDLNKHPIHHRPSGAVAYYAMYDARLTFELDDYFRPEIEKYNLGTVRDLEDDIIYAVASMEREGALLNIGKLMLWQRQAQSRYLQAIMGIYKLTGIRCEPSKPSDLMKLFKVLGIKSNYITPTGGESFNIEALKEFEHLEPVRLAIEAKQLKSLKDKFIDTYIEKADSDGRIRYSLNQLKATNDEGSKGAVTGRFSSSGGGRAVDGVNIQQVIDDEKQDKIPCIADFPIRDAFIPADGYSWISADARQIEFRIFAHYSNSARLLKAYQDDPLVDFHSYVATNILHVPRDRKLKQMNFGRLYGMGAQKLAEVYLKCPVEEAKALLAHYDAEFPEARGLLQFASERAKEKGFVKTLLGRRRTYSKADSRYNPVSGKKEIPYYSALNAVIQGLAADIMKMKIRELHRTRKETGLKMRFTVHDEVDGDIPGPEETQKVAEILNSQSLELQVPILWDVRSGATWKEAH